MQLFAISQLTNLTGQLFYCFLKINELRQKFEQLYDIVIVDPESMTLVGVLLMKLLDKH